MRPPTRTPAPEGLATGLNARLGLVLSSLSWRHDDVALDMYRHAEHLARYAARATRPLGLADSGALSRARALAAADRLDAHLAFLDRIEAIHGPAVPATRRALARLVHAVTRPPQRAG